MNPISLPSTLKIIRKLSFPKKLGLCDKIYGRTLATYGSSWVLTSIGIPWKLDLRNPTHRWIVYGLYQDPGFLKWVKKNLPQEAVIVDSGSNIGQMLLYFASWFPKGKILAFEPGGHARTWLEQCLKINKDFPVELLACGLGSQKSTLFINHAEDSLMHGGQAHVSSEGEEQIEIERLDTILESKKIKTVDLWKLDVEGYELEALLGAEGLLKKKSVKAIYVEFSANIEQQIIEYLRDLDYALYYINRSGKLCIEKSSDKISNGFFLPRFAV